MARKIMITAFLILLCTIALTFMRLGLDSIGFLNNPFEHINNKHTITGKSGGSKCIVTWITVCKGKSAFLSSNGKSSSFDSVEIRGPLLPFFSWARFVWTFDSKDNVEPCYGGLVVDGGAVFLKYTVVPRNSNARPGLYQLKYARYLFAVPALPYLCPPFYKWAFLYLWMPVSEVEYQKHAEKSAEVDLSELKYYEIGTLAEACSVKGLWKLDRKQMFDLHFKMQAIRDEAARTGKKRPW